MPNGPPRSSFFHTIINDYVYLYGGSTYSNQSLSFKPTNYSDFWKLDLNKVFEIISTPTTTNSPCINCDNNIESPFVEVITKNNTTAIVVGIVVPIVLIAILAIIAFLLIKR